MPGVVLQLAAASRLIQGNGGEEAKDILLSAPRRPNKAKLGGSHRETRLNWKRYTCHDLIFLCSPQLVILVGGHQERGQLRYGSGRMRLAERVGLACGLVRVVNPTTHRRAIGIKPEKAFQLHGARGEPVITWAGRVDEIEETRQCLPWALGTAAGRWWVAR